jgi:ATP-dependent Clp protease ATP-binding subunit ClpA
LTLAARDFATAALPRIDAAWSQRDMWNVIDQVSTTELGGTANTARHRSLAETGGAVLEWVSTHRDGVGNGLATDRSLADAVAQWLAVTVTSGDDVEALSQPEIAATRVLEWSRALFGALGQPQGARGSEASTQPRLVAWFEGAADTGKTLAAHWLAASVGGAVERVDLAQVVSKYMGETEKNLDRVFSSASTSGAVLLFDEADALLGKRTDVRDSHDRYANLESNVLLQRLEQFEGVAVLTSNAAARIDPDLRQRAKAVFVAFPLPPR